MDAFDECNYPFYIYPRFMSCGYKDLTTYRSEVARLKLFLDQYKPGAGEIFHLTIGASMEEIINNCMSSGEIEQHRQLFPIQLERYIRDNPDSKVSIIIVSPNITFSDRYYKDPLFIKMTPELGWEKNMRHYKSTTFNVEVNIFCTMFPHEEIRRNTKYIEHYRQIKIEDHQKEFKISDITQTQNDVKFIESFYERLDLIANKVAIMGGLSVCLSFAVFNNRGEFRNLNDFVMFDEIKKVFGRKGNRMLLCEWEYDMKNYEMNVYKMMHIYDYSVGFPLYNSTKEGLEISFI